MRLAVPFLIACVVGSASGTGAWASTALDQNPIYRYTTEDGRSAFVDDPARIPDQYRSSVTIEVEQPLLAIYRYTTEDGRSAYTNDLNRIPADRRAQATVVDLSHISLNHELAADLSQAIDTQYEALQTSRLCQQVRVEANVPWSQRLWDNYAPLLVIGALLLVLAASTPLVLRHMHAALWARLLTVSVSILFSVGLLAFVSFRTSTFQQRLLQTAAHCQHDGAAKSQGSRQITQTRIDAIRAIRAHRQILEQVMQLE